MHAAYSYRKETKTFHKDFIPKTFPVVRFDMVHEQGEVFLYQAVKRSSFWKDIPYEIMVPLGSFFCPDKDVSQ
ncbi:hypothetical protein DXA36_04280 [Eisenbergiella sp. OF01-20]|nr:hypothetical protein DXA36_04280 [Eisenbergiella sp. OF01-20]